MHYCAGQDSDCATTFLSLSQLFRRVAAALPGMESTQENQSRDDCILVAKGNSVPVLKGNWVDVLQGHSYFYLASLPSSKPLTQPHCQTVTQVLYLRFAAEEISQG